MTASPEIYAILCSCKGTQAESAYAESAQESTLRGLRREVRFILSSLSRDENMNSMRLSPPETPGERARRERQPTEILCTAEKVSVFGAKAVRSAFPSDGKVAANADG